MPLYSSPFLRNVQISFAVYNTNTTVSLLPVDLDALNEFSDNSIAHPSRYPRAGGGPSHLDQAITHLKTINQMTTGIYIQDAIMESTAQPFDVIAELLNLNSLKTTDLRSPTDMKNMIAELKDIRSKLTIDYDKELTLLDFLRLKVEMDEVKQLKTWDLKDALMADMKEVQNNKGFDISVWEKLQSAFEVIQFAYLSTNQRQTQQTTDAFDAIKENSEKIIVSAPEALQNITASVKLKSGNTITYYLSSVPFLFGRIQSLEDHKGRLVTNNLEPVIKNIKTVAAFSRTLSPLLPTLSALQTAFNGTDISRTRIHTPGFRFADLKIIDSFASSYAQNEWIKKIIDIRKVSEALKPIHPFSKKTEKISEALNSHKPKSMYEMLDYLQKFEVSSFEPRDVIIGAMKCANDNDDLKVHISDIFDFGGMHDSLTSLRSEMVNLRKMLKEAAEFAKSAEVTKLLKGLVQISGRATESLEEAVKELNDFKPVEMKKILTKASKFKTDVRTGQFAIQKQTQATLEHLPNFLDKFESIFKDRKGIFRCLKDLPFGKESKETIRAIPVIWAHFYIPPTVVEDLDKLPELSRILWDARDQDKMIEEMSERRTEASEKLKWLGTQSNTVGQSIEGIMNLRNLLEHRKSFEAIQTGGEIFEMNLTEFQRTIRGVDTWAAGIPDLRNEEEVVRFAPVFREAVKVEGVENLEEIRQKVKEIGDGRMKREERIPFGRLQRALEGLDNVGMKFSGYRKHYEEMVEVLDDLGIFFMEYRFGEREIPEVQPGLLEKPWFIALLSVSGILTLLAAGLGVWYCRKKKKLCFRDKGKNELKLFFILIND
uniref:WSN domain-containing protein n=1 Tax=Caenorhabditis tropicalis TaxID=1561998 RepID=A0A1I7UZF8_9PELO